MTIKCCFCDKYLKTEQTYIKHLEKIHNISNQNNYFDFKLFLHCTSGMNTFNSGIRTKISKDVRDKILERDKGCCALCGQYKRYVIHHIIPDGDNSQENLITLCIGCHTLIHRVLFLQGKWKNTHCF